MATRKDIRDAIEYVNAAFDAELDMCGGSYGPEEVEQARAEVEIGRKHVLKVLRSIRPEPAKARGKATAK